MRATFPPIIPKRTSNNTINKTLKSFLCFPDDTRWNSEVYSSSFAPEYMVAMDWEPNSFLLDVLSEFSVTVEDTFDVPKEQEKKRECVFCKKRMMFSFSVTLLLCLVASATKADSVSDVYWPFDYLGYGYDIVYDLPTGKWRIHFTIWR